MTNISIMPAERDPLTPNTTRDISVESDVAQSTVHTEGIAMHYSTKIKPIALVVVKLSLSKSMLNLMVRLHNSRTLHLYPYTGTQLVQMLPSVSVKIIMLYFHCRLIAWSSD